MHNLFLELIITMVFSISLNFYAPVNFDKTFFEKIGSSVHQWVVKCDLAVTIPQGTFNRFWIALDRVNTVVFNLHQIKCRAFFGHPVLGALWQKFSKIKSPGRGCCVFFR